MKSPGRSEQSVKYVIGHAAYLRAPSGGRAVQMPQSWCSTGEAAAGKREPAESGTILSRKSLKACITSECAN